MENDLERKKKVKRILNTIGISFISIVIFVFVLGLIFQLAWPETAFAIWSKDSTWDISKLPEVWATNKKTIYNSIVLFVIIFSISKLLRILLKKFMEKSNRAKTVITLIDGIVKYATAIILFFLILEALGVNTRTLWESAGVIALIIGLGAQTLIADIIAGIFIIFEDEYSVGEIVSIDDFRGTVSEIGIRATKIIDMAGNIKIINNSDIKNVVNLSRELSLAVVDCEFPYDVPIEFIEKLIKEHLQEFKEKIPGIIEGPYYKGVSGYGSSNVSIRLMAKCHEEERYQVQRDLLREYRQLFVANGIDLSYEQVVLNQPSKSEIKLTQQIKREAEEFVKEQKALSSDLEEQEK